MKFEKQDDLIRWENVSVAFYRFSSVPHQCMRFSKALSLILLSYKGYLQEAVPSLIGILGGLIKEKADCEVY